MHIADLFCKHVIVDGLFCCLKHTDCIKGCKLEMEVVPFPIYVA